MKRSYLIFIILIFVVAAVVGIIDIIYTPGGDLDEFGDVENTFYATIKEIREYNGVTTLLVSGLDTNDVNHRGEFSFNINKTEILWKGSIVSKSYLKEGMLISIGKYSNVQETYPARLVDVKDIIILQDKLY